MRLELILARPAPRDLEGQRGVFGLAVRAADEDGVEIRVDRVVGIDRPAELVATPNHRVIVEVALEIVTLGVDQVDPRRPGGAQLALVAEVETQGLGVLEVRIEVGRRRDGVQRRALVGDRLAELHEAGLTGAHGDPAEVGKQAVLLDLAGEQQGRGAAVEQADAATDHVPAGAAGGPGEAEAGREVVVVGDRRRHREDVLEAARIVGLAPAHAEVERQVGVHPPAVLDEEAVELLGLVVVGEGDVAEIDPGRGGDVGQADFHGLLVPAAPP